MANTFSRKTQRNIGTTATNVGGYYVPADTIATVIGLSVANTSSGAIKGDVMLNDGANDTYLVKNADIAAGGALIVVGGDQKLVMVTGDSIKVKSTAATSIDVVMSVLEISTV